LTTASILKVDDEVDDEALLDSGRLGVDVKGFIIGVVLLLEIVHDCSFVDFVMREKLGGCGVQSTWSMM
jgi:hypothetical protein